jgi:hypothetical protein
MEYRASLFAQGYFGHFIVAVSVLLLSLLILSHAYLPAVALAIALLLGFARLRARRMVLSSTSFRYDGWLRGFTVSLDQVARVMRASAFGYPINRLHGNSYCVLTNDGKKHWVGLLFFEPPACRAFHQALAGVHMSDPTVGSSRR